MKKLTIVVILILSFTILCQGMAASNDETENELTNEQRNAIAMLNYIMVLTQEINESKNNRLYLEEAYSLLISNTYSSRTKLW